MEIQLNEIKLLKQIYLKELEVLTRTAPHKIKIICAPFIDSNLNNNFVNSTVDIIYKLSDEYPQEAPKIIIEAKVSIFTPD